MSPQVMSGEAASRSTLDLPGQLASWDREVMTGAEALAQAAQVLSSAPASLQLRYLETLTTIAADKNSTIVFPLPMDIVYAFLAKPRP